MEDSAQFQRQLSYPCGDYWLPEMAKARMKRKTSTLGNGDDAWGALPTLPLANGKGTGARELWHLFLDRVGSHSGAHGPSDRRMPSDGGSCAH